MAHAHSTPGMISRRAALASAGAVALAAAPMMALAASGSDAATIQDAEAAAGMEPRLLALATKREELIRTIPEHLHGTPALYRDEAETVEAYEKQFRRSNPAFLAVLYERGDWNERTGYRAVNEELERLTAEQDTILTRLMSTEPTTPATAAALCRVWIGTMVRYDIAKSIDPDDWCTKCALAAQRHAHVLTGVPA